MSHSPTLSRPKLLAGELRLENAGRERAGELRRNCFKPQPSNVTTENANISKDLAADVVFGSTFGSLTSDSPNGRSTRCSLPLSYVSLPSP